MYTDPAAYKQKKLEDQAAQDAAEIARLKDPDQMRQHYEKEASKDAEELLKITEPLYYQRRQEEKEKAELYAELARMEDPEYLELKAKVEEARKTAHMTELW